MGLRSLVLAILTTAVSGAYADGVSCLPEFTSLRAEADFGRASQQTFILKSVNPKGMFETKARMTAGLEGNQLSVKFHWDENFSGVSLPYNLYSLLVVQDGVAVGWFDFTHDCEGPGVGFFPGQSFSLPPLKTVSSNKQIKFIIFGRIN